jgi:hypothetical protein
MHLKSFVWPSLIMTFLAWLQCIDATGSRDISKNSLIWSYPVNRHCCATPAISAGMVFVGDCGHQFHCVDAETGKPYWTQDVKGDVWGSALVADGRVYLGTRRGDLWTFAASKDKKVLATVHLGDPISSTPVAAQRNALHRDAHSALRHAGRYIDFGKRAYRKRSHLRSRCDAVSRGRGIAVMGASMRDLDELFTALWHVGS